METTDNTQESAGCGPVQVLVPPSDLDGLELVILVRVPDEDRAKKSDDIAEAYAVAIGDVPGGCVVWGFYHGRWVANVSCRWLLSRFIRGSRRMVAHEQGGGTGWWSGFDLLKRTVTPEA